MSVLNLHYLVHTSDIIERHKPKAPWLRRPFVFQYNAVIDSTKLSKVVPEVVRSQVMWQSTHEYFSVLLIIINILAFFENFVNFLSFRIRILNLVTERCYGLLLLICGSFVTEILGEYVLLYWRFTDLIFVQEILVVEGVSLHVIAVISLWWWTFYDIFSIVNWNVLEIYDFL